jgi:hypothetical protein
MIAATPQLTPSQPSAIHPADLNWEAHPANPLSLSAAPHPPIAQAVPPFIPEVPDQSRAASRLARRLSHISNVLNVMWTLCYFLHRRPFVFINLQTLFAKTGGMGVFAAKNSNDILIYFTPERKKAPDRLGGGHPGLGG